jgi:transcriptional regulator with XRE-family HTH domain
MKQGTPVAPSAEPKARRNRWPKGVNARDRRRTRCSAPGCEALITSDGLCRHHLAQERAIHREQHKQEAERRKQHQKQERAWCRSATPDIRSAMQGRSMLRLAVATGISAASLYDIRSGHSRPRPETLRAIEQGLRALDQQDGLAVDLLGWLRPQAASLGVREFAQRVGVSYLMLSRYLARGELLGAHSKKAREVEKKLRHYRASAAR